MKFNFKNILATPFVLALLVPLGAQANSLDEKAQDTYNPAQVKHKVVQDGSVLFPQPSTSYLKKAPVYDATDLELLTYGLNKDDIRRILGNPHFNEFSPRDWNYIISVKNNDENQVKTCQLQVHFGNDGLANKFYWNSESCVDSVYQPVQYPPIAMLVEPQPEPEPKKTLVMISRLDDGNSKELVSKKEVTID